MTRLCGALIGCLLVACAPLHQHDSKLGDTGEVAGRVLLCAISFCMSELGYHMQHEDAKNQRAYQQYYQRLSPEQQDREDQREAVRLNALGMALSGGPPFRSIPLQPLPQYQVPTWNAQPYQYLAPRQPMNCMTQMVGTIAQTNCY